jgi:hypothetical protein
MPQTNADDPLRTTDHEPSAATPDRDATADFAPGPPGANGGTAAYVPGEATEPLGAESERVSQSLSVPGYEIEEVLGRGGMGVVYKARHLALKRTVALKMVLAGGHAGPQELARFRLEAEAVARLQHPNIVQIHEVGEADGHPYCALEFVEGGSLAAKLAGKPLPPREAAQLVHTLARAVQLAHSRNVVHRDLKPANVLLASPGRVSGELIPKITDFGLARQLDSDSGETQAGQVMGTPSYMAPEQASGRAHEAGPAADVYALGAILYECLAGQPPFRGQTVVETLDLVRTQEPVPPSRHQPGVPLDLETICLKCLRKEPGQRYPSAAELADDLARYQRGEPIQARPVGRIERAVKWVKRNPWLAAAAAAVVLALAAGTTVSYLKYRETEAALARESERVKERDDANDNLLNVGARGLLRPLAAQVQPNQPVPPLIDQEIEPLWELATATDERLRLRFVELALDDPHLRRRLTDRAPFAFQAAIGLDSTRRTRVEELLGKRLQATEISAEEEQLAFCLAHLGSLDGRLAGRAAATLTQAISKTTGPDALRNLAQALSAVAPRLEPKEAARLSGLAAGTLSQAMSKTMADNPDAENALQSLAQGLSAVAARLESKDAAAAAAALAQAVSKVRFTDNIRINNNIRYLEQGLSAVTARLEPKEAAELAATLLQAMRTTKDRSTLERLAQAVLPVSGRLEPKEAADVAATVVGAMSKGPGYKGTLVQVLLAVSARMEPKEAAATLIQVMNTTRDSETLRDVAQGLSAVSARLEPKEVAEVAASIIRAMSKPTGAYDLLSLAQCLAAVSARLERKEAARLCGQAAATLTQVMSKPTDARWLGWLAQGLAAVAALLEPEEAARLCSQATAILTQTMSKTTDPYDLQVMAEGLSAVSARLEPKEAARVCGQAAAILNQAISKTTNPSAWWFLGLGLSAVSARLEPKEAVEVATTLTQAMNKTTDAGALKNLAQGLSAVSARLEPKAAAQVYGQTAASLIQAMSKSTDPVALLSLAQGLSAVAARPEPKQASELAATVTQAMSKTKDPTALGNLAQALSAVAAGLEPKEAGEVAAPLTQAMSKTTNTDALRGLGQGLSAVLARELSPQTLVDLLKHPCCVGEPRRLVLDQLARHYQRPFADQWEFIAYAQEHLPDVDLDSPPQRPMSPDRAAAADGMKR